MLSCYVYIYPESFYIQQVSSLQLGSCLKEMEIGELCVCVVS